MPKLQNYAIALGVLFLVVGVWSGNKAWSPAPKPEPTFFRTVVSLTYQGAPLDIEAVVGCGVHVTEYRYGGTSVEINDLYPTAYARPVGDGHAVLIRTMPPNVTSLCARPQEEIGLVPKDWRPTVVWYERADDLSHGLGYVTEAAYHNPNAVLAFRGAQVELATRADFDAFMANAPKNIVPAYMAGWMGVLNSPSIKSVDQLTPEMRTDLRKAWPYTDDARCRAAKRVHVQPEDKAALAAMQPAGQRYWSPEQEEDQLYFVRNSATFKINFKGEYETLSQERKDKDASGATVYPIRINYGLDSVGFGKNGGKGIERRSDIIVDDSLAGFAYCDISGAYLQQVLDNNRYEYSIAPGKCHVNGTDIAGQPVCQSPWFGFEGNTTAIFALSDDLIFY